MANDHETNLIINADASGVADGVRKAENALAGLSDSVDSQSKDLNRYGEKLGAAFGPGQGLHGRLDNLETPLRDTEGAIARSQMAFIEFGNKGATAADKVGAGMLLAGDAIAAFTSGGVVGVALAAAVAGFSLLTMAMNEQTEASRKAEEAAEEQAKALKELAKTAASANKTIALVTAEEREKEVRERVRFIDQERRDVKKRFEDLQDRHFENLEALKSLENANPITGRGARKRQLEAQTEADRKELEKLKTKFKKLNDEFSFSWKKINEARRKVEEEAKINSESLVTQLIDSLDKVEKATTDAVQKETKKRVDAVRKVTDVMAEYAKSEKQRTMDQQALRKEDEKLDERFRKRREQELEHERQVERDNRAFDRAEAQADKEFEIEQAKEEAAEKLKIKKFQWAAEDKARKDQLDAEKKASDARKAMALSVANTVTGTLFEQAKAGELNAEKLLAAVLQTTGRELVARGTLHFLEGVATTNPAKVSGGGAMIAAGLAMGAASGAVARSGETPESSAGTSTTPIDTRETRAASGSGDSGGGTVIVNFNGPAYDRRGVSQVVTSAQRMAKHRRIAGA